MLQSRAERMSTGTLRTRAVTKAKKPTAEGRKAQTKADRAKARTE